MGNVINLKGFKNSKNATKKVEKIYRLVKKSENGQISKKEKRLLEKLFEGTTCGDLSKLNDEALKEMIEFAINPQEFVKKCEPIRGENDWPTTNKDSIN